MWYIWSPLTLSISLWVPLQEFMLQWQNQQPSNRRTSDGYHEFKLQSQFLNFSSAPILSYFNNKYYSCKHKALYLHKLLQTSKQRKKTIFSLKYLGYLWIKFLRPKQTLLRKSGCSIFFSTWTLLVLYKHSVLPTSDTTQLFTPTCKVWFQN